MPPEPGPHSHMSPPSSLTDRSFGPPPCGAPESTSLTLTPTLCHPPGLLSLWLHHLSHISCRALRWACRGGLSLPDSRSPLSRERHTKWPVPRRMGTGLGEFQRGKASSAWSIRERLELSLEERVGVGQTGEQKDIPAAENHAQSRRETPFLLTSLRVLLSLKPTVCNPDTPSPPQSSLCHTPVPSRL